MFRALRIRRRRNGRAYDRLGLGDEPSSSGLLEANLKRSMSLPSLLYTPKNLVTEERIAEKTVEKEVKKVSKIHPLFSLFVRQRKKKATAKPEFARYLEYLKEGGIWDLNSNMPVIYYK